MDVLCGRSGLTRHLACGNKVHLGWQRWATAEEVNVLHAMGELSASETEATVPVYACRDHRIDRCAQHRDLPDEDTTHRSCPACPSEQAAQIHDATCRAPAEPGDCSVCEVSG